MRKSNKQNDWAGGITAPARQIYGYIRANGVIIGSDTYLKSISIDNSPHNGKPWGYSISEYCQVELLPTVTTQIAVGDMIEVGFAIGEHYDVANPNIRYNHYIVDSIDTDQVTGVLTLNCYDKIYQLNNKTYADVEITYPCTLEQLQQAVLRTIGGISVPIDIINKDLVINSQPYTSDTCLRDVLDDILELTGGICSYTHYYIPPINESGFILAGVGRDLQPSGHYVDEILTINKSDYYNVTTSTDICQVSGVACTNALGDTVSVGDGSGYVMVLADNDILAQMDDLSKTAILTELLTRATNIIRPYSIDWRGNPALLVGDIVKIIDKDNNEYLTAYMGGSLRYDGGLRATSSWESEHTTDVSLAPTSSISDVLKVTKAIVDKTNQQIELTVAEIGSAKSPYATLKMRLDAIEQIVGEGNITFAQPDEPIGVSPRGLITGDLWINTDNHKWYRYDGTNWVQMLDNDVADIVERVSRIEQTSQEIKSTVTEINTHLGTVDSQIAQNKSVIDQLSTSITSMVTRTEFDESLNTISSNMSRIEQTADSVSTEVSNARNEYSTLKQRIDAIDVTVAGGNKTYRQSTTPVGEIKVGDMWFDISTNKLKRYDGTQWIILTDGDIASVSSAVTTLQVDLQGITGTVQNHTEHLSTIDGSLTTIETSMSQIKQTADAVSIEVSNACDQGSTLKQTLDSIRSVVKGGNTTYQQATAPITDIIAGDLWYNTSDNHWYRYDGSAWQLVQDGDIATAITQSSEAIQTATAITTRVSQIETDIGNVEGRISTAESSITQLSTAITLRVEKDGIISSINQTPEEIKIESDRINLSGYVTFSGNGSGESVINGDNIITNNLQVNGDFKCNSIDLTHIYSEDVHIDSLLDISGVEIKPALGTIARTVHYQQIGQPLVIPVGDDHIKISSVLLADTVMPKTDNLYATVLLQGVEAGKMTTATIPLSMVQGQQGGGGNIIIPCSTPSAVTVLGATLSTNSMTYYPTEGLTINKPFTDLAVTGTLTGQQITANDWSKDNYVQVRKVLPAHLPLQSVSCSLGSATNKWDDLYLNNLHIDRIGSTVSKLISMHAETVNTETLMTNIADINQGYVEGLIIGDTSGFHIVIDKNNVTLWNGDQPTIYTKSWIQLLGGD